MNLLRWIFGRPEPKRIADPAFGELFFVRGAWSGSFSPLADAEVTVRAGEGGPTPRQRDLFVELRRRFDGLQPAIEERLASEYLICREVEKAAYERSSSRHARAFDLDFPPVREPKDIRGIVELITVEVYREEDGADAGLLYNVDWADPEHCLIVVLKDWKVIDGGKEG